MGLAGADSLAKPDIEIGPGGLRLDGERGADEPLFDFFLEEGEDAMTRLGYGVVSYFSLIYTFLLVFALITACNVPVMYFFSGWTAFEQYAQISWTARFTVGNLGASEARCLNVKMISDSISVSCTTGQISEVTHFGVYQKDSEADQRGLCSSSGVNVGTGFDCSSLSRKDSSFFTDKLQSCVGQSACMITGVHDDISLGPHGGDCDI